MTREKSIVTQKGIVINDKVPAVLIIYVQGLSLIRDKLLIKKQKSHGFKIACQWTKKNKKIIILIKKDMV